MKISWPEAFTIVGVSFVLAVFVLGLFWIRTNADTQLVIEGIRGGAEYTIRK